VQRRVAAALGVWLLACAGLVAAEFWKDKEFTAWSPQEVTKMLTDSPWSRAVSVVSFDSSLAARVGGLSGGIVGMGVGSRGGRGSAGGGVGGDGAGNIGGGSFMAPALRARVAVRWASALPVKLASSRRQPPGNDGIAETGPSLEQDEPFYRVAVADIPQHFTEVVGDRWDLQEVTLLKRKNREPIRPVEIHFTPMKDRLTIEFHFPRTDAITIEDAEVEFLTVLGETKVRETFKLRDMMFRDRLTL